MTPTEVDVKAAVRAEDREIVRRMAAGDEVALGELYDRYQRLVFGLARRILGKESEAEEILQEVFLQAWNQAARYEQQRSSVSTWLALIARSRAIDRIRTRRVVDRTHASFRVEEENRPAHTSSEGPGAVLHDERRERLAEVLTELPDEQREVLEKAYFTGLTQSEIAKATGIPLGTVKTRTLLALRKLREALSDEIEDLL